jgi:hypothetical protein
MSVTEDVKVYQQKLITACQQAMVEGMRKFEAYEVRGEMSGRPGLERKSGALARDWKVTTEGEGLDFSVKLSNSPATFYAKVHQEGMTIRPKNGPYLHYKLNDGTYRMSKEVTIPKRLNITENFETVGKEMIMEKIKKAFNGLHKA